MSERKSRLVKLMNKELIFIHAIGYDEPDPPITHASLLLLRASYGSRRSIRGLPDMQAYADMIKAEQQ